MRGWTLSGIIVVLLILAGLFYWVGGWSYFSVHANGQIIVNSPSVYTRQRLVNDRLSQSTWLKDQLKLTESPSQFRAIDQIFVAREERSLNSQIRIATTTGGSKENPATQTGSGSNEKPTTPAGTTSPPGQPSANAAYRIDQTTGDLFRAMNNYRDEVRSEMMQTLLDDRHDIYGNTIYRLALGATVLAGTGTRDLALVSVTLRHNPMMFNEDYEAVYEDWGAYVQRVVNSSLDGLAKSFAERSLEPRVRLMTPYFVVGEVCRLMEQQFGGADLSLNKDCDVWNRDAPPAISRASQLIDAFVGIYLGYRQQIIRNRFDIELAAILAKQSLKPDNFERAFEFASRACQGRSPRPDSSGNLQSPTTYVVTRQGDFLPVNCPISTEPNEGLIGALMLYNFLVQQPSIIKKYATDRNVNFSNVASDIGAGFFICRPTAQLCDAPDLRSGEFRCIAADFVRWNLNGFGNPDGTIQRIDTYLDVRTVGRSLQDCSVVVRTFRLPTGAAPGASVSPLEQLKSNLNQGVEVYAYSITPKNMAQRVSMAVDTREALQLLLSGQVAGATTDVTTKADALRNRSDLLQQIQNHAIVVPFGRSRANQARKAPYETDFGWAIIPRLRGSEDPEQVDAQYGLSAVISVPGWWRSIKLDIHTCWISRSELQAAGPSSSAAVPSVKELCSEAKRQTQEDLVRLPGTIEEVSRKLGFEVIQEPYLDQDQLSQVLQVGYGGMCS